MRSKSSVCIVGETMLQFSLPSISFLHSLSGLCLWGVPYVMGAVINQIEVGMTMILSVTKKWMEGKQVRTGDQVKLLQS